MIDTQTVMRFAEVSYLINQQGNYTVLFMISDTGSMSVSVNNNKREEVFHFFPSMGDIDAVGAYDKMLELLREGE